MSVSEKQAAAYKDAVRSVYPDLGSDLQIDAKPQVADSADGAFVAVWLWVAKSDANICLTEDCPELTDDGEGYNGLCGNCADRREAVG